MFRNPADWTLRIKETPDGPGNDVCPEVIKEVHAAEKISGYRSRRIRRNLGIVTMEDLVEEIFGDIEDEHDNTNYIAQKVDENEYVLSGRLEIEKANELLGLDLPESEEYVTVSGLILHQYQSFPKLNEIIRFGQFRVQNHQEYNDKNRTCTSENHRITKI